MEREINEALKGVEIHNTPVIDAQVKELGKIFGAGIEMAALDIKRSFYVVYERNGRKERMEGRAFTFYTLHFTYSSYASRFTVDRPQTVDLLGAIFGETVL